MGLRQIELIVVAFVMGLLVGLATMAEYVVWRLEKILEYASR